MSVVARVLSSFKIDYPGPGSQCTLEDNPGDHWPIHLHIAHGQPGSIRLHFTYEEFYEIAEKMMEEKRDFGSKIPDIPV